MRIVFMGTPEFAVPSLKALLDAGHELVGVVTATDKIGGRGKKQLIQSPVKKYALSYGLPVLQPKNLKSPEFIDALKALQPEIGVVVAFRMLPEVVWSLPPKGTINLHASLLPKYRGAAPINWAIINGEHTTGLTTFFIQKEIDTGDIILQRTVPIGPDETAGELHDRMMHIGAQLLVDTLAQIESGDYELKKQNDQEATPAPKIYHETCAINWNQPAVQVYNFIRGLSPYPAAWTLFQGKQLDIYKARREIAANKILRPGTWETDGKSWLRFATTDGYIYPLEVKLSGKRRMPIDDLLRGLRFVALSGETSTINNNK